MLISSRGSFRSSNDVTCTCLYFVSNRRLLLQRRDCQNLHGIFGRTSLQLTTVLSWNRSDNVETPYLINDDLPKSLRFIFTHESQIFLYFIRLTNTFCSFTLSHPSGDRRVQNQTKFFFCRSGNKRRVEWGMSVTVEDLPNYVKTEENTQGFYGVSFH